MKRLMMLMVLLALLLTVFGPEDGSQGAELYRQESLDHRPHCVRVWERSRNYVCDVVTPAGVRCVVAMKWLNDGGIGISCDWSQP